MRNQGKCKCKCKKFHELMIYYSTSIFTFSSLQFVLTYLTEPSRALGKKWRMLGKYVLRYLDYDLGQTILLKNSSINIIGLIKCWYFLSFSSQIAEPKLGCHQNKMNNSNIFYSMCCHSYIYPKTPYLYCLIYSFQWDWKILTNSLTFSLKQNAKDAFVDGFSSEGKPS